MLGFIDEYRVEPICRELPVAPSQYYEMNCRKRNPERLPTRVKRAAVLVPEIERTYAESECLYGARKTWRELRRERWDVARYTTERLMSELGLQSV